jgi:DNA-binding response OmpR family regulator
MKRILLIENEAAFALGVSDRLKAEGYEVEWAQSGPAGFKAAARAFDLILLDVMLPGKNGFDICRDLRMEGVHAPILTLTAGGEVVDRVLGLKLGADDYVQKNCDPMELLARIEALLRRTAETAVQGRRAEFGEVRVDLARHELLCGGKRVDLSPLEFRLLEYLIERRGAVVTREELFEKVWNLNGDAMSRTIDVHIAALRRKIEENSRYPRFLLTVRGAGYKMEV